MKNNKLNAVRVSEPLEGGRGVGSNARESLGKEGQVIRSSWRAEARPYRSPGPIMKDKEAGLRRGQDLMVNGAQHAAPLQRHESKEKRQQGCRTPKVDAGALWKQIEDVAVPQLGLSVIDHVVYSHLVRHSRLEGRRRLRFSIPWLARNIHLSVCPTREAVRRLAAEGALLMIERSKAGHVAEVRLPEEIRGVRANAVRARRAARLSSAMGIEEVDFLKTLELRRAIHARERGKCFYCLRRVAARLECIDHVVPRAKVRCNSYRNLVSSCMECNSQKGERPAEEFLRWLFRERRLTAAELRGRFRALELLASGKLRPELASEGGPESPV